MSQSDTQTAQKPDAPAQEQVKYSVSGGLVAFLAQQNISFAFSSYQSGKFYLIGRNPKGGLMINERFFQKAMGIAVPSKDTIWLATMTQLLRFENTLEPGQAINHTHDACYVPRTAHITGAVDAHDVGVMKDGRVVFVTTRFNCLATLSPNRSFQPVWKPDFIDRIVDEDRYHLNGMALEDGVPRYVTAVSKSNTIDGWRDRRGNGGIIIDVQSGKIICEGLSMPHSPRIHDGKLWVLNSGTGELGWVEPATGKNKGKFHPVVFCPGFTRGLAFHGKFAFVGLSKPRYERFEGLALDQKLKDADSEPWCGVQVIDLGSGSCVHWLRLDGPVAEMFDTAIIPEVMCPMAIGFATADVATFIVPDSMAELPSA